jgi:hypothetical protein
MSGPGRSAIQVRLHAPERHLFERHCRHVLEGGLRVLGALLDELVVRYDLGPAIDELLERYAELDPGLVRRLGADRFVERGPQLVPAAAA